jgi:hypothetical protein
VKVKTDILSQVGTASVNPAREEPSAVLASMNASMCLTIAKTVGKNFPELAVNLSNSLITILKGLGPNSMRPDGPTSSPLIKSTMESVFQYASELEITAAGELRSVALSLMLVVASAMGSVEYMLATVDALSRGAETLAESALCILEDLGNIKTELLLSIPTAKSVIEKFSFTSEASKPDVTDTSLSTSSVTFNGTHLYIWDPYNHCIRKIGSGLNGTIQGVEVSCYRNIISQLNATVAKAEWPQGDVLRASINCLGKHIYFASSDLLGAGNVASFSSKTLLLESVRAVGGPITAETTPAECPIKEEVFMFAHTDVVDIRASRGYTLRVKSATFHEQDCTEIVAALVSNCDTVMHFGDIVTLLGDPAPGMPKQLVINVECLPVRSANGVTSIQDIEIVSAFFFDANFGGEDVSGIVRQQFDKFCRSWVPGVKSCELVSVGWLPDQQPSVVKTLWINFKSAREDSADIRTVSFTEHSVAAWEAIPSAVNAEISFSREYLKDGLTTDGRHLIVLNSRTVENPTTRQAVYNGLRDIVFSSAYYYDTNYCGPDIGPQIEEQFSSYLNCMQMGTQQPQTVSATWLSDNQVNVRKTLWINFQIGESKKQHSISFEEDTIIDWNIILREAYTVFSGFENQLEVLFVDPAQDMRILRRCLVAVPSSMSASAVNLCQNTSLLSNGQKLVLQQLQHGGRTDQRLRLNVFLFDICGSTACLLSSATEEYEGNDFFPSGFTYDSNSNFIWSWDFITQRFARWKNAGLRPQKNPFDRNPSVYSSNPAVRLQCLWPDKKAASLVKSSSKEQAIVLCSLLDKLSEAYAPVQPGLSQEVYPSNEIELVSKGYYNSTRGYSLIKIRGKVYGAGEKPDSGNGRSYNVVTLHDNYYVDECRNFDTAENSSNVDSLIDFISCLPEGKLVLISTNNSAVSNMNLRAFNALRLLGADTAGLERNLTSNLLYESFAMIGRKGSKPGTAVQKLGKENKQVIVRVRIPSQNIPLAVELSKQSIARLVKTVIASHEAWTVNSAKSDPFDAAILISVMHILTVNIHQLLSGISDKAAAGIVDGIGLPELRGVLSRIIDTDSADPAEMEIAKAGLKLFIEALNLLYSTSSERQALLLNYLQQYARNQLSVQETKILQLLLNRVASPRELVPIAHSEDTHSITDLLACLMNVMKSDLPGQLSSIIQRRNKVDSDGVSENSGSLFDASVGLASALSKMLLSRAAQEIVLASDNKSLEGEVRGKRGGYTFVSMVSAMMESCNEIVKEIVVTNKLLTNDSGCLDPELEELLHSSLVGTLLPFFFCSVTMVFRAHGTQLLQWVDGSLLLALHTNLSNMARNILLMIRYLPTKLLFKSSSPTARKVEKVIECSHPYDNNMDTTTDIFIPGAKKLVISFDPASRTENGCDFLRFVDMNGTVLHPTIEKFCGRDGSQNWPGCEGRPELELECNQCRVLFHSDGSVTDWGYKFTVVGIIPGTSSETHWLTSMEQLIVECKTAVATPYLDSVPWNEGLEDSLNSWMSEPIISAELFQGKLGSSEEDIFLMDLIERPSGSLAESFATAMKKRVREDQGSDESVNKAVYATCAAIVKLNNLTTEALALAKNVREEPSNVMIKAWASGQKMRSFFDLADAQTGVLTRQDSSGLPSLYAGSNPDVQDAAAQEVIARAQFLVRIPADDVIDEIIVPSSPRALSKGSSSSIMRSSSYLAKQRWGLLAKSEGLQRQDSADHKRRLSWTTLVNNVVVSEKVKNILAFRKKTAGRKKGKQSITERILAFVQSRISVEQLEQLSTIRTKRCALRAQGIIMLAQSIEPTGLPSSLCWVLYSFASALRRNPRPESAAAHKVHYGALIEGSVPRVQESLASAFGEFLERVLAVLETAKTRCLNSEASELERTAWISTVIACLRALAIDYQETDHPFLEKTQLLHYIGEFSRWKCSEVREVSQSLLEVLVDRCVAGIGKTSFGDSVVESLEPTAFSLRLVETVTERVKSFAVDCMATSDNSVAVAPLPAKAVSIAPNVLNVFSDPTEAGFSHPHVALGLNHTLSIWIKRPVSSRLDEKVTISAGCEVMRGPGWSAGSQDGGIGCVGTVVSVDSALNASVLWPNGTTACYKWSENDSPISLADKTVGGTIVCKGSPALFDDKEMRTCPPAWALFGLEMFCDGTVGYFISNGKARFIHKSPTFISAETWTHVTVVQQKQANTIFIDGTFVSEMLLEECLVTPSTSLVIESFHPYADNLDTYQSVSLAGAKKLTITFDEQSRTENGCDYVKFYKNDSRGDIWGEQYTGRDGTRNFPGLDGKPPLIIPASSFVLYFHSDGSNNDWGYKFKVEPDEINPEAIFSDENVNFSPFYIGNGPVYSSSFPAMNGQICDFKVFPVALKTESEVEENFNSSIVPKSASHVDDQLGIASLSLLLRGLDAATAQSSLNNALEKGFASAAVLKSLFSLIQNGTPTIQMAVFRVLSKLVPSMDVEAVNSVFVSMSGFGGTAATDFVPYLFFFVGSCLLTSTSPETAGSSNNCVEKKLRRSHEYSSAVASDAVGLLRALTVNGKAQVDGNESTSSNICLAWRQAVTTAITDLKQNTATAIQRLKDHKDSSSETVLPADFLSLVGFLSFAGGLLPAIYPGAQCLYLNDKGLSEACTVVSPASKPAYDPVAEKELYKQWKDVEQFGEAVTIVLNSEPEKPLVVQRQSLSVSQPNNLRHDNFTDLSRLLKDYFDGDDTASHLLLEILTSVCTLDTVDTRPILLPNVEEKSYEMVYESSHPYADSLDIYTNISLPGVETMNIIFKNDSRLEQNCDYVRFYKDSRHSEYWGNESYTGRDGTENFPGCGFRPPLEIPADSCVMYFHTDSSGNDWGYHLTVTGTAKVLTNPPEPPTLPQLLSMRLLKMMGMKCLAAVIGTSDYFVKATLRLGPSIMQSALAPLPERSGGNTMKPVIIESKHPYDNSMDEYQSFTFKGAKRLSISFDPQSQTENGCDYLRLYT